MTGKDCETVICGGNAKLTDTHLLSTVHCVDDEIIQWLKRKERNIQKEKAA